MKDNAGHVRDLLRGDFGVFFAGRTIDLLGSSMTTTALALAVLEIAAGPIDLGIVLAANMIPTLILLIVGGAVADRYSQRVVLVFASLISGVAIGSMALVLLFDIYELFYVSILAAVAGMMSAFSQPAFRSVTPHLVDKMNLQRANALLASSENTVRIMGPMIASLIVVTVGGGWALALDALTFLAAGILYRLLPLEAAIETKAGGLRNEIKDGWSLVRQMRWFSTMAVSFAFINAFNVGPWNVLGPTILAGSSGAVGWGAVQTVRAAGLLVMSIVAVKIVLSRPLRDGRLLGVLGALPLLVLGVSTDPWLVGPAVFLGGFGIMVAGISWETVLHYHVPKDSLARVAAYDDLLSFVANPISLVLVGPLAARFGAQSVCLVCGIGFVFATLLPLSNKFVRSN